MAKRYPLSRASREYDRVTNLYPWLPKLIAPYPEMQTGDKSCLEMSWSILEACSAKTGIPIQMALAAAFGDGRWVMPDDLPWLARWQACRQVYRIDEQVAAELAAQDLDGDLPTEALRRMPYPILYIDCRVPVSYPTSTRWAYGFFAYIDRDPRGELDLAVVYLMDDGTRSRLSLMIEDGTTLESCLQHVEDVDREVAELSEGAIVQMGEISEDPIIKRPDFGPDERARLCHCATVTLNMLLFVLSAENGAEVIYTPPKISRGQKVGKRTNTETVRMLGAKIGAAIGAARRVGYPSSHGTGERTMAPHVRRAHWQSFWTGKRKGREDGKFGDELVVKWIPPIPVNQGAGEVTETVHMNSPEGGK